MSRRAADHFASSYVEARRKFLDAADAAGLDARSYLHPLPGCNAEPLAMDVVVDGDRAAGRILIVSSGCHGVEGFAGSGVQVFALQDAALREQAKRAAVALVHIHALNPFGFSHLRRTTHENVDLNRNFHDFSLPLPVNEEYRRVHPLLLPADWPPPAANEAALLALMQANGLRAFQAVVTRGQHEFPSGLLFGGSEPSWSNLTLRSVLRETAAGARQLGWIDLHTGLGPMGVGERILACDGPDEDRARAWWGPAVTSIHDESSSSTVITGPMWTVAREECPRAQYTGIALEYGTTPIMQVLQALRADHWLHANQQRRNDLAAEELQQQVARQMLAAFFVDTDEWKDNVVGQAREAISQGIAGLGACAEEERACVT